MEFLLTLIKRQELIKGTVIFDYCFLFTAYADDSTFSGLKPNIGKCEIAGIGLLKRPTEAICGLKLVDLSELRY